MVLTCEEREITRKITFNKSQNPVNQILQKFENLEICYNIVHLKLPFYVSN